MSPDKNPPQFAAPAERTKHLEKQSQQLKVIADYFTAEAEAKRETKKAKVFGSIIGTLVFIGTVWPLFYEGALYTLGEMKNREAAENYATVAKKIYYDENNPEIALTFIKKSVELDPDNSDYRYLNFYIEGMAVVRNLLNLDRPLNKKEVNEAHQSMASAALLKLLEPEKSGPYILKGQIYSSLKENERSLIELKKAISLEPNNDFAHVRLALIHFNLNEIDKSLKELDLALKINPDSKWAWLWKGIVIGESQKDWETANSNYKKALEIDPRFDLAYYNLGWSFLKISPKDFVNAQNNFETALKINPNYKEALYGLAMVYGYQDRYEIAKLYLTKAKDLDNQFLTAWKWLGVVNNEMNNFDEALVAFGEAIKLNPGDSKLYVRRARLFSKDGQFEQGIKDLRLAAEMSPKNKRIWFYLGDILLKMDKPEGAINYFDKAVKIAPNYGEAFLGKAKALAALGSHESAEENFEKSFQVSRNKKERVIFAKGNFEISRGNLLKARNDFKTAREIKENFGDVWLAEADVLVKLKKTKEAIALLKQYLKLRPEDNKASAMVLKLSQES